jgi:predicted TIM-barrel fold metal-dependent hydrolase
VSPVVDTHLHYWQWPRDAGARADAQSLAAHSSAPVEDELPYHDVAATMQAAGVEHAVQVTRTLAGYDNGYSLEGARQLPHTFRVCGRFDPAGADVARRLGSFVSDPSVVAVRLFWYSGDDGWLSDGSLDGFLAAAEQSGVAVCVYAPRNMATLPDVASRFPGLQLVVDHLGANLFSPLDHRFDHWDVVCGLAKFDNVYLKVSALPEATGEPYPFPAAQERVREVYEVFGADRLMWGSNYPLTTRVCTYAEAVDLIRSECDFFTPEDRAKVLGGTASRVFRLPW